MEEQKSEKGQSAVEEQPKETQDVKAKDAKVSAGSEQGQSTGKEQSSEAEGAKAGGAKAGGAKAGGRGSSTSRRSSGTKRGPSSKSSSRGQTAASKKKATASGTSRAARAGAGRVGKAGRPSGTDVQEVEWQFDVEELERVEGWLGEHTSGSGMLVSPESAEDLVDTYYDTEDWRFYRAGYALRVRGKGSGAEATMKSLASAGGSAEGNIRRRREISEPLSNAKLETLRKATGPVGERVRALVGTREVRPMFEIRTHRQTFALQSEEQTNGSANGSLNSSNDSVGASEGSADDSPGEIVQDASGDVRQRETGDRESGRMGKVVLDSSEIPLGDDGETTGLTRVEVEVREENASDPGVREFVKALEGALGLRPAKISKYEAGIFATGLSPSGATGLGSENIDGTLTTGEMAFAVLRRQFANMRAHEAGTRLGEDPEELHDMRVATRRMRAALRLFEDALPERARWLQEELRWIGGSLGEVRDSDVQIEQLEQWAAGAGEEGAEAFVEIIAAVKERREEARKRMLDTLNSGRYARFEGSFAEMLRRGPDHERVFGQASASGSGKELADEPVLVAGPGLLSRRYRKWSKAANRLNDSSHPEEYHDLRKKGKRLRYALEFFTDVYSEKATGALIKPLKSIQDSLGDHQDAIVASDRLHEIATDSPKLPPQTAFMMGSLAQRHVQEAAGLRASLASTKAYRILTKGKAWKSFGKIMDKERAAAEKVESEDAENNSRTKASKAKAGKGK